MRTFLLWLACTVPLAGQAPPQGQSPEVGPADRKIAEQPAIPLTPEADLIFATTQQGRELLGRKDVYIESQSELERQIRLQTAEAVSDEAFLEHVQQQVLAWDEEERQRLTVAATSVAEKMSPYKIPLPAEVLLIRTTGQDESGAAYTRGEGIVLPRRRSPLKPAALERLLMHELFHVISRHDPDLRKKLYAVIRFQQCNPIELPESIAKQQITNPDAPTVDYYITIDHQGEEVAVVPILLADRAKYDSRRKKLFDYLQFRLMVVEQENETWQAKLDAKRRPILIDGRANKSYREKIGGNTGYIIHPDEILADNFVHLLMQTKNLKSPEVVEQMQEILTAPKENNCSCAP